MSKKKLFSAIALVAVTVMPATLAVSCVKTPKDVLSLKDKQLNSSFNNLKMSEYQKVGTIFDKQVTINAKNPITDKIESRTTTLWELFQYLEGEVVRVTDGDTLVIRITKQPYAREGTNPPADLQIGTEISVRIPFIDTLEEHTHGDNTVDPEEKRLALQDHEFAEKLLPVGTKVRLVSDNWSNKTYNRYTAAVFFGEGYQRNFSTEMLAGGYTLPRLANDVGGRFRTYFKMDVKASVSSYILPFLAYAYNEGVHEKRGFYQSEVKDPYDLASKYKSHGEGIIEAGRYILSQYYIQSGEVNEQTNIFKWLGKELK